MTRKLIPKDKLAQFQSPSTGKTCFYNSNTKTSFFPFHVLSLKPFSTSFLSSQTPYRNKKKQTKEFDQFRDTEKSSQKMALSKRFTYQTYIPLPSDSGVEYQDHRAFLSLVPIHIVTNASQLPKEFLFPSKAKQFVIGFDCEGIDLGRYGTLCIMQFGFSDAIYLVDAIHGGEQLMRACKPALESSFVTKVIHDCKRDSEALYFHYGIKLHNVVDTQIAYSLIEEQLGRARPPHGCISFVKLLADPRYCGISYLEKKEVRTCIQQDPKFWECRPLTELMVRAAADDVRFLPYVYHKMMEKLNERLLWLLAVRGALYCRCFCSDEKDYEEWPSVPSIPDNLKMEGKAPEEQILSVVDVPTAKMGRIIGKKGVSIMSIKKSCNAEILIRSGNGLLDKVFIIGSVKQVRKAEALLRGRL